MPPIMALTDPKVRNAKPQEKPYRLADSGGLYLEVMPQGSRYWRLKYRFLQKEKRLALGVYPSVSLADARAGRDAAKALLRNGIDPGAARKENKRQAHYAAGNSFEAVSREWHAMHATAGWTDKYAASTLRGLEKHVFPALGATPVGEVKARDLLTVLRRVGQTAPDRAKRIRQHCSEIFRYAIASDRAEHNPAADIGRALHPAKKESFAALNQEQLPMFLRALSADKRLAPTTRLGLRILALTFVRPGELRNARWAEFDLKHGLWTIPGTRMKSRQEHLVPLSPLALAALRDLHDITGPCELLFPSRSNFTRPISDNTFRKALHDMGFKVTAHGFRSTASTILNEMGFRSDVIERQLAHGERDKVRAAYNRAQYLPERKDMMRHWSEYLAAIEAGGNVIVGNFRSKKKPA